MALLSTSHRLFFGRLSSEPLAAHAPHKGDPDNFALLLQLLDQDLYVNGDILAEASAHGENRIMVRRLKEDMKHFDGSPCFPPRHVETLPYELSKAATHE